MKPVIFAVLTVAMLALASPVGAAMLGMSASHANHATGPPSTPGCVAAFAAHPGTLPDQASASRERRFRVDLNPLFFSSVRF